MSDLVEVTRCKDCKWWDAIKVRKNIGICTPPSKAHGGYCIKRGVTTAEDYCSQAEKGKWEDRHKRPCPGEN